MLTAKHLYTAVVIAILAVPATVFLARWGYREGRLVAYEMRMHECENRNPTYRPSWRKFPRPHYRCVIELDREFPEINQ